MKKRLHKSSTVATLQSRDHPAFSKRKKTADASAQLPMHRFVALMAPENRIILSALLRRLNWKRVSKVKPNHIIKTKFPVGYSRTVETASEKFRAPMEP